MDHSGTVAFTVGEFSSEDTKSPASNLSKNGADTLWTSSSPGTSQESVVLKLEAPSKLQGIHVVNNFSGLLEVQATKSSSKNDEWETIVAKSSLMTPMDARAKRNGHVKRDLTLLPLAEEHEWSKLKFVCHQPFSKELPYGLSRIQITAAENNASEDKPKQNGGGFSLRKKANSNEIKPGSLFASSLKKEELTGSKSAVQAALSSSRQTKSRSPSPKPETSRVASVKKEDKEEEVDNVAKQMKPLSLKRKTEPSTDEETEDSKGKKSLPKKSKSPSKRNKRKKEDTDEEDEGRGKEKSKKNGKVKDVKKANASKKQKATDDEEEVDSKKKARTKKPSPKKRKKDEDDDTDDDQPRTSKKKTEKKDEKKKTGRVRSRKAEVDEDEEAASSNRPGSRQGNRKDIMKGCVIALSGFANPLRGELRENAIEMGAKYRPNWTDDCTHLICAFANTPKYNEVRAAGGRILKKEWVLDCCKNKKMMPWRNYMLKPVKESQDDENDELEDAKFDEDEEWEPDEVDEEVVEDDEEEEDELSGEDDEENIEDELKDPDDEENDEEETDEGDEIDELPLTPPGKPKKKASPVKRRKGGVHFDGDDTDTDMSEGQLDLTDTEEADIPAEKFVPRSRPLFRGCGFFLYGDFPDDEKKKLETAIKDLAGEVREYNDEKVTHCVTLMSWLPDFDEAKAENPTLAIVQPSWVYQCQEKMTLLDPRDFKPKKGS
ncbi:hypothetical protein RvY_00684 [Ramazzottius varieornatus]|uniref:BRCT domain-containing protein n=1 Tax=Ramazzottius varieornatus TaxID=947166 RepID=A0A1D1UE29_RAMVA|nr:hypothetical protein RvY_00684 [Ramazzottius varieornatus]